MIYPVVLCGGSGTRLWPLSRKSYPKQFVLRSGDQTLFQSAASRLSGEAFAEPTFVTASDFRFIVTEQLYELGQDPLAIIIEPGPKNTAPAILAAALQVAAEDENALMLVMPSDHLIPDAQAFEATVMKGVEAAKAGRLVTFGIKPTYAETGYGYLELDGNAESGPVPLKRFVEKPDLPRAEQMLEDGGFLWNAGIFLFSVRAIREAFSKTAPELVSPVTDAVAAAKPDLGFLRLDPEAWERVEDISIDYAVMEKADALTVVPFSGAWSDLGGWDAVWREGDANAAGVVTSGEVTPIDCADSLLRSESDGQELVGIGLSNIIAVAMPDAVLVADRSRAQDVKKAVDALKAKGSKQATAFPRDHRPWGWFDSLVVGDRFQVKRIFVHPGAALSLQSHVHRAEHWIVVSGTARVTVDDDVKLVSENQSIYIPLGAVHRMENPGKVPMVLIEVQTGSYLGEDDIVRYEDVYARS
ncbi:MAG: mannose-1-phosphate guanylyltransferase/mannose-6-phosphate isomerase [Pseudomonadota bacterium]